MTQKRTLTEEHKRNIGEGQRRNREARDATAREANSRASLCGLIIHRKGCTCNGWSRHARDYAPGFRPSVQQQAVEVARGLGGAR